LRSFHSASSCDRARAERDPAGVLWVDTAIGLVAGMSQTLGFLRWPFLAQLAQAYLGPGAREAQRAAASMVFEVPLVGR
jgi:hypothetical protein